MRLALSNLAFPAEGAEAELAALAQEGLKGIEVAPTRIAPWAELTPERLGTERQALADLGLSIPSLQAILFGAEGVALLKDAESFDRMAEHLREVAAIGALLGAKVAVFGAPRQRSRGEMPAEAAFDVGAERLGRLAGIMHEGGMALGLEPVPPVYGGDFLTTWQDVLAMVRAVDHPGLRLHLDTSCVMLGGGDIREAVRGGSAELAHFHAAEPKLAPFAAPEADHGGAAAALARAGYDGWVAIEMLEAQGGPWAACREAVIRARSLYAPLEGA